MNLNLNPKLFLSPLLLLLLCCSYTSIAKELPVLIEELAPPVSYSYLDPFLNEKQKQQQSETDLAPLQLKIRYNSTFDYFIGFSTSYKF